jgi:cyclase
MGDGTRDGYDLALTKAVAAATGIPVIASGGAGKLDDFRDALLFADAALAAGLFHEKTLTVRDVKAYVGKQGIPVRLG